MSEYDPHDDQQFFWEEHADSAVERLLADAEFDEIRGTISLPPHNDDGMDFGADCPSLEVLEDHLREVHNQEWYSYVPFDGGEAVFEDDAWGAVENHLTDDRRFYEFFERHSAPSDTENIVTAGELLLDLSASRAIRVSLEEINDELIAYLSSHPHLMREMNPRKFEELVAAMFRNQGYDVTLTPRSNDGGTDVIAVQRSGIGTAMIIVECKRYAETNKVGVEIVRGLYGVLEHRKATRGIIATTSFFTRGATQFCNDVPYRLALADFNVLTRELNDWKTQIDQCRTKR